MSRSPFERRSEPVPSADRWVEAGLISPDQRDAIRRFEAASNPDVTSPPEIERTRAITPVAEVAGYLSGIVAIVGGLTIVGPRWSGLALPAQLAIAVAIAVIGFAAGAGLIRSDDGAAARLGGFAWVVSSGGAALAVATVVGRSSAADDRWVGIATGLSLALLGTALWRNRDRPLQLATVAVGVALAVGGILDLAGAAIWVGAVVAWCAGAALGGLVALDRVHPRSTGFVVGAVAMTSGAFQLAARFERASAVLAVATAAAIVAIALVERSLALLGVGVVAFVAAVTLLMSTVVEGTLARTASVAIGLVVLAAVGVRAQRDVGRS